MTQRGFELEYREISLFPTCIGNRRIRIEPDGRVREMCNVRECEPGEDWSAAWREVRKLTAPQLDRLIEMIEKGGLLSLPSSIINEVAVDGVREEIDVQLGERHHTVAVQNSTHPVFSRLQKELRQLVASGANVEGGEGYV